MKHIYQSIMKSCLGLCTLLFMVSCGDFLEITPRDLVTEDNFWDEKKDVDQMVAGCYTAMQHVAFMERCIVWGEMRGDDVDGKDVSSITDIYQAMLNNLLPSNVYTDWASFYYVINKCNTIIRMAPEVSAKDPSYRESDVKATIAEVTALRSLCYWYLIRTFKDVPFTRDAIQQEDEVQYLAPTGFDQVLNNLIADLESVKDNALDHFPTTSSDNVGLRYNSNCNRITRNVIRAMLCDMYLWRGDYDLAIQCVNEILEVKKKDAAKLTNVKLYTGINNTVSAYLYDPQSSNAPNGSYQAIFGNDGNSYESIFELSFNYNGSGSPYIMNTALGRFYGSGIDKEIDGLKPNGGAGWLRAMNSIVGDGQQSTAANWQVFRGRSDIRFYCSMQAADNDFGEATIRKGVASTFKVTNTTPYVNYNSSSYESPFIVPEYMNRNWIFYRLTDVMLMGAEAYIMKATDANTAEDQANLQKAIDLLDLVNQRSVLQSTEQLRKSASSMVTNRALTLKEARRERRCELMFEGKRFFDIIRYCYQDNSLDLAQTIPAKCNSVSSNYNYPSFEHLYWPYNRNEVKRNPNLQQKSIYNKDSETFEMNK